MALRQGEILSNLIELRVDINSITSKCTKSEYRAHPIEHDYVIVLSQDCDLEQDYNYRTLDRGKAKDELPSILFCEVMNEEEFVGDDAYANILQRSTTRNNIEQNNDFRFHRVQKIPKDLDARGIGLPELVMAFKRYFTVPTEEVYHRISLGHVLRRSRLRSPYLEHFCGRFHYFNNRIALPEEYESLQQLIGFPPITHSCNT